MLATALAACPVRAQPAAGTPSAAADPETIVVVGKRETPLSRVASAVTILDAGRLQQTLTRDIRDAVRYEPGLTVPSDPIRFGLDSFAIRGMGGNRVAAEIDGVPVPAGFAVGNFSHSGRSFIELDFVDRIEFLRGPASSLYGSDAIAGVVAFDTLDPDDLALASSHGGLLRSDFRGEDASWSGTALAAARGQAVESLAGFVWRSGHEADIAGSTRANPRDYEVASGLGKLRFPAAPGGALELALTGDRQTSDTIVDALLGQPGRFANTVAMRAEDSSERLRLSLEQNLAHVPGLDGGVWRVYYQRTSVEQDTFEERRAAPPRAPDPLAIERRFVFDTDNWGGEITATSDVVAGSWTHGLVYGMELDATRIEESRDGAQTNLTTGTTTNVILGESFPLRDFPNSDVLEIGVYLQDEIRNPGDRWSLIPALRVDYYELEPAVDATYAEDNPNGTVVAVDELSVSPKLGLVYRIRPTLSVFAQYARGFRAPPFEDVNIGLEIPLFNVRAIANPELEPETSDGYELGLRAGEGDLQFEASAYYTRFRNFIESRINLGPDPATGVILFQSQNIAEARIYGVEASLSASLDRWLPGWSLDSSLAWSRGDDTAEDVPLNSVEPARGVMALAYDSPAGRWGGELVCTAVDRKRRLDERNVDLVATDAWLTLDLLAHLELAEGLSVNAALRNLTDERYLQWVDVQGRTADDPLLPYYVQPGRSVSVAVAWRF